MGLTMRERKAVTQELAGRYQKAGKKERGRLLAEFIALTGYSRCYASNMLHNWGRRQVCVVDGERVEVIVGTKEAGSRSRQKPRRYDERTVAILERLWAIGDGICGKRLRAFIDIALPVLEQQGEIVIDDASIREKLQSISPATIDRLLGPARMTVWGKERTGTKPGTLLKHQIPIRTFTDWDEKMPGFLEIDLVGHDGGSSYGEYLQSIDGTDIATTWTETGVVKNKAQKYVFARLKRLRSQFPFPIYGLDSDNGVEFINNELLRYCVNERLTFTRSRPYRKNDNCFVEQKNYTIVRRVAGYYRYETDQQLELLEEVYKHLRLYTNFFLPCVKLVSKTRTGSVVHKHYDRPQTPFQRVLAHPQISDEVKRTLRAQFETLNPAQLKRTIAELQAALFNSHCALPQRPILYPQTHTGHPWKRTGLAWQERFKAKGELDSEPKRSDNPHDGPLLLPP
jgi:hypothetical protein